MLGTLRTLIAGASARSEEAARDHFAIDLIDQKIREATINLKTAKRTLASLIQRERAEQGHLAQLDGRVTDLETRARDALAAGQDGLAGEAARAIADLENERTSRRSTCAQLDARILQLRTGIEAAHRRLTDLKQGAITARAVRREQSAQSRLFAGRSHANAMEEAEALIAQVMTKADPFEEAQILQEIDAGLTYAALPDKLADAGFGTHTKSTQAAVLARLKTN